MVGGQTQFSSIQKTGKLKFFPTLNISKEETKEGAIMWKGYGQALKKV